VNDDRTQVGPAQPRYRDPFEVLHNALFDAPLERDQLSLAIQQQDDEDAVTRAHRRKPHALLQCLCAQ